MAPSRFSHKKLFDEGGKGVGLGFCLFSEL